MNIKQKICIILLSPGLFIACKEEKKEENPLAEQISEVKSEFAPDKRVALFDINATENSSKFVLRGESNLPNAVAALKEKLSAEKIAYIDSIQQLPAAGLGENTQALVKISVANLRSKPAHSAELATQATLGTPVKVFKQEENWYLIQTPDAYLSWVDSGGIELMNEMEVEQWKAAEKVIYTNTVGQSYGETNLRSQVVSDLVAGAILEKTGEQSGFYAVKYPDGRSAFVPVEEAQEYGSWLENLNPTEDALVGTSKTLMGIPYLWGGTSTKGVDCSGFTKTIYFLNGMVIPRDASQQVHSGQPVDSMRNFESLERGDLLFFGRKATDSTQEKVVHVGMWIGNDEFIHSSGRVHISSMNENADNFDAYNLDRYLRSNRYLTESKEGIIELARTPLFKD